MHVYNALTVVQMQFAVGCAALKSMILIGIKLLSYTRVVEWVQVYFSYCKQKSVLSDHSCPSTYEEKITIIALKRKYKIGYNL